MKTISQSPTDPDFVQNPYDFYDRARCLGPIVRWDDYELHATTTYDATNTILRDRRFGREQPAEMTTSVPRHLKPFFDVEDHSMLELEPPRHTRLRGLVLRAFTSRRIATLEPEVRQICQSLLSSIRHQETDLLTAYAQPVPILVISRLLGVPDSMADQLLDWSHAMVGMYQAKRSREMEDAAAGAAADFSEFLRGYVEERRSRPADDLITALIAAEEQGERLSTDELISTCILLLNAGHEATVHTLGNGIRAILDAKVRNGRVSPVTDDTLEEILRFDPPLHMFTRYAYETVEIEGVTFRRGEQVACLLAAGNRDPAVWSSPDLFDPQRPAKPNLAFGAGMHFCVGAPLARLELRIALNELFSACPDLHLSRPPSYADIYHFHGLQRLDVRLR